MGSTGGQSKSCNSPQGRLHSPLPLPAKSDKVTHHHKLLCQSPQEPLPVGGITSTYGQNCIRTGHNSDIFRVLQPPFSGFQTQQAVDLSALNQFLKTEKFYVQGQSYQIKALPFSLSTAPIEFMVVAKEVKPIALQKSIRINQYLDDWLVRARSQQTCLQHSQTLVAVCQELVG